jgi:lysophospholipase L1-like esterase
MTYDPAAGLYVGGDAFGLPAAPPPPLPAPARLEHLIRFEHARKRLAVTEFAGAATLPEAAEAALHLTDAATLRRVRERLRARALEAAAGLPADLARSWRLDPGSVVVALGDSITDDAVSWAEILRAPLEQGGLTLVNAGLSGDTTADLLRRLYGVVALDPALVVTMVGTNDAQRHGRGGKALVTAAESTANLRAIRTWLRSCGARTAWITSPPVDEAALAAAAGPRPFVIRNADVRRIAASIRRFPDPVVESASVLGDPPRDSLLMSDGVHPSDAGQALLASALADALSVR